MKTQEIELQTNDDGELFIQIPDDVLDNLGWCIGDDLVFTDEDNGFLIKKKEMNNE